MGTRDEKTGTEREATEFSKETGYRPSVNQRRHEPMPASRHDERRQDAVLRNEEHAGNHTQAAPSRRSRRRDGKRDRGRARREG
jgi:hypothetical protein